MQLTMRILGMIFAASFWLGKSGATKRSEGCNSDWTELEPDKLVRKTIRIHGIERSFLVYAPTRIDSGGPFPLVLNWHGTPSDAMTQFYYTEMDYTAYDENFILVFPDGVDQAFNAGGCCSDHNLNDEKFARDIVEWVGKNSCVDMDSVYTTGWSNGAYMSYYLACKASDVFKAAAPVGGLIGIEPYEECNPQDPPPILAFHEKGDPDVDYFGGGDEYLGAEKLVEVMAQKQGCSTSTEVSYSRGEVVCKTHVECPAGKNATLCSIDRNKHTWPGAGESGCEYEGTKDIDGNIEIWNFFKKYGG